MGKINVIFGTHNSLPYGSPDAVFENAYQKDYKPFLTELYNNPELFTIIHYSGIVLDWLKDHHPEFLMLLNDMVKRKQVELLGGGFYDPFLPLIPHTDRLGQVESLTTLIRERFGKRPRGGWITENIWDPALVSMLKNSGLDYIFLEEYHFINAGLSEKDLYNPVMTEDQGKVITVYPIASKISERIQSEEPESIIDSILSLKSIDDAVVTLLLKGEYLRKLNKDKWIPRFLKLLHTNRDKISVVIPVNLQKKAGSFKKCYFLSSSFGELSRWYQNGQHLVNTNRTTGNIRKKEGLQGNFRKFLTRYYESNLLYSKMMYTQILVKQIRGDRARKKAAREELWKGQCNQTYWHTPFGGIYQNNLRKKAYKALLEAEKITQEKGIFIPSIVTADFDMDGETEYLYQGDELNAYAHLHGGMIFELDYLPASWNYLDTFSRYPELYHGKECENKGVDWYPRKAFVDHFLLEKEHISKFDTMSYQELGTFVDTAYDVTLLHREQKILELRKNGSLIVKKKHIPIQLTKVFRFKKSSLTCTYTIVNKSGEEVQTTFGSEINLSFGSNCVETLRFNVEQDNKMREIPLTTVEVSKVSALQINDISNKVEVTIRMDQPCRLWSLPVETCYLTQENFETQYQSSCFLTMWNVQLPPEKSWTTSISLSFSKIKKK